MFVGWVNPLSLARQKPEAAYAVDSAANYKDNAELSM